MGTFSYNTVSPADKDKIRAVLADTEDTGHILDDEDIKLILQITENDFNRAIAMSARACAARVSEKDKVTSQSFGSGVAITKTNRADIFLKIATDYEKLSSAGAGGEPIYEVTSYADLTSELGEDLSKYQGED